MKTISDIVQTRKPRQSTARNTKEDLIEQIVEQTTVRGRQAKDLRRLLAVAANTLKWTEADLAVLLGKKNAPKVRSYTTLV